MKITLPLPEPMICSKICGPVLRIHNRRAIQATQMIMMMSDFPKCLSDEEKVVKQLELIYQSMRDLFTPRCHR